ncbi:MAG: DUF368 domain-containing protein [Corynebacterium sp.]|nr:DUF368 domain-containing protein [Corynebacterium sp.]
MDNAGTDSHHPVTSSSTRPLTIVTNIIRGALIGMAELVPGISGGTVALVVGIYEKALINARRLARLAITRKKQAIDWPFLFAVAVGMFGAVFLLANPIHYFVEHYPVESRGLFMGMVIASIAVPIRMMQTPPEATRAAIDYVHEKFTQSQIIKYCVIGFIAAAIAFIGTSMANTDHDATHAPLYMIFIGAAIAICALVLPGVSGSYILLSLGLYGPVIGAVKDRDLVVMGVFCLGALVGIALFIRTLTILLERYRNGTLAAMTGLMIGSLQGLWPWSGGEPQASAAVTIGMIILGAAIVVAVMLIERRYKVATNH